VKEWKIHLAWVLATPLLVWGWSRWSLAQREPEFLERERAVAARKVEAPGRSIVPASPVENLLAGPPSAVPAHSPNDAAAPSEEEAFVDSIRRLFQSERREDLAEAARRMDRIPKGPVRVDLLRAELRCKEAGYRYNAMVLLEDELGADVVPILQDVVRSDPETYVRRFAVERLGGLGGIETVNILLEAFRDPDRTIQLAAAASLNALGQKGPAEDLLPRLAEGLNHPDGAVRRDAAEDIGRLRLPSAMPVLLRCFRDSSGDVRFAAARWLAELEGPGLLPALEEQRKDPDPNVQKAAQTAIARYRTIHERK
jgi:hypothetical protein